MTDDVRRKQNCQDDHDWQGKSLLVVTGQARFCKLALAGKAVSLRQSYGRLGSATGEEESESARENPVTLCVVGRLPKHGTLISLQGTQLKGKAVLSHLHGSICLQLSEVSTSFEDLFHEHLLGGL